VAPHGGSFGFRHLVKVRKTYIVTWT